MTKQFHDLRYGTEGLPGCCGVLVFSNFREDTGYHPGYYWGEKPKKTLEKWSTKEEQAEDCYNNILEDLQEQQYTTAIITLVSKYHNDNYPRGSGNWMMEDGDYKAQLPEFQQLLIKKGWEVSQVFVNPNHGNEVTMFTMHFPQLVTEFGEQFDEEDAY